MINWPSSLGLKRQPGDPLSAGEPASTSLLKCPCTRHQIPTCSLAVLHSFYEGRKWKRNLPTKSDKGSHYTLQGGTAEGEAWAVIEGNVFIIHPRFTTLLKILVPLWLSTEQDICREKEPRIDGQGGGRDYLTFIMVELIKKGRSLFLSGEERERDLFLALTPLAGQDRSTVLCEPVSENPSPTAASSNTHRVCPACIIIALSDEYTFMAVMKKEKELQTFYSTVNIFSAPGGKGECWHHRI